MELSHRRVATHLVVDRTGCSRQVTVAWTSPANPDAIVIYCADGQLVPYFEKSLHRMINGALPVLVGVHSTDLRSQEYLPSSKQCYLDHEAFFVIQLRNWMITQFGIEPSREKSIMFGFSNGGAFALHSVLQYSHLFAGVFSFSTPPFELSESRRQHDQNNPWIYLATGNQGPEKSIRKNVLKLSRTLERRKYSVTFCERQAGHTLEFWLAELTLAWNWYIEKTPD